MLTFIRKGGIILGSGVTSFYLICQYTEFGKGYLPFRIGRSTFTVSSVIIDYKLYYTFNSNKSDISQVHEKCAKKLLKLILINGGCFIKLGQHIASLSYILPSEYLKELKVLHSEVPPRPFYEVYENIREELQKEPFEVFSEISSVPLGTASLAQVHKGKLRENNNEVALKVQHREVRHYSQIDMLWIDYLFRISSWLFPQMQLEWLAEETRESLPLELDFIQEGRNSEIISKELKNRFSFLKIPGIYWNYCTPKLLVMEYYDGGQINDLSYIQRNNYSPEKISKNLCRLFSEMIFEKGLLHCDPHPGNILVCKPKISNETSNRIWVKKIWRNFANRFIKTMPDIVLLDHGLYKRLSEEFLINYSHLWLAMMKGDEAAIEKYGKKLGAPINLHRLLACIVSGRSWESLEKGLDGTPEFTDAEKDHIKHNVNNYIPEVILILSQIPRPMLYILKTSDLLRGIENSLLGHPHSKATMGWLTMTQYSIRRLYLNRDSSSLISNLNLTFNYYRDVIYYFFVALWLGYYY